MNKINKFLTTPLGSLFKTFFLAMIMFAAKTIKDAGSLDALGDPVKFGWACFWSGCVALANMLYNWFNPKYQQFGNRE